LRGRGGRSTPEDGSQGSIYKKREGKREFNSPPEERGLRKETEMRGRDIGASSPL